MYFKGKKSELVEQIIKLQDYDLILYLEPDVKWVEDGFRFAGKDEDRIKNNEKLKKMFKNRGINFTSINGDYTQRFNKSRELIDDLWSGK
jgi:HTH-type transcriptional repressor of NAD biosynthesis genes